MGRVVDREECVAFRTAAGERGQLVVFTNGCFDLVHRGHLDLLRRAKALGDLLIVGVNGDESVRRLKGAGRPIVPAGDRAELLAALEPVDRVVLFHEDTPAQLIEALQPDVLVKGGDYALDEIVGRDTVEKRGGVVRALPLLPGRSTTSLMERIARSLRESD